MLESLETRLRLAIHDEAFERALLRAARYLRVYRDLLPRQAFGISRTLLDKTDRYELVAVRWSGHCQGPIFVNPDVRCWSIVVDGQLYVRGYKRTPDGQVIPEDGPSEITIIEPGDLDWRFSSRKLYRISNHRAEAAIALQLYAPSLATQTIVDESSAASYEAPLFYEGVFDLDALTVVA